MTKQEVISLLDGEIIRCRMAPKINGCAMTEEWKLTIEVCEIAIEAIREQEQRRWIPLEERYPKESEPVLIYCWAERKVEESWLQDGNFGGRFNFRFMSEVSHWMPMPEPQKDLTR